MKAGFSLFVPFLLLSIACPSASGADVEQDIAQKIGFSPPLGDSVPLDIELTDSGGRTLLGRSLKDFPRTVLVPVWYGCRKLCGFTLESLARGLSAQPPARRTQIVVYSINPAETTKDAGSERNRLLSRHPDLSTHADWRFATLPSPDIRRLSTAIGFRYDFDGSHEQFRHVAGAVVIDRKGVERAFLPGPAIKADELGRALAEDRPPQVPRLASFCFTYDPQTGQYSLSILRVIQLLGLLTIVAVAVPCVRALRREGRSR